MDGKRQNSGSCADCPIRFSAVCSRCEPEEMVRMEAAKRYRSFGTGERILWAGGEMEFVASVVSGTAAISLSVSKARKIIDEQGERVFRAPRA